MSNQPCCGPNGCSPATSVTTQSPLTEAIREGYAQTARAGLSSNDPSVAAVARAFGYSAEELAAVPAQANMGLSCGNPIALANLRPGETVVDLGSGGGLDVFLAAHKVGPTGRAIGIDMTPDMIALAQRNAHAGPDGKPYTNVDFKLGRIDQIPLPDACADVILSNCVINLAPDKQAVFAEMFRILKPGGRVAISDIVLKQTLPHELAQSVAALVGCIAGAIPADDYHAGLTAAGFADVALLDTHADLTAYTQVDGQAACCAPPSPEDATAKDEASCCSPAATPNATSGGGANPCTATWANYSPATTSTTTPPP